MKRTVTGLGVLGLALMVVLISASESLAKTTKVKGSGSASFVTAFFSYDGVEDAFQFTGSGKDNLGGQSTFQVIAENGPATATVCTAPDGTAGLQYDLVAATGVTFYNTGQLFSSAVPSSSNHECVSNTTGSFGGTITYTVNGGTGKFATATGSVTATFTGQTLAAPLAGAGGFFGSEEFTVVGSVTK